MTINIHADFAGFRAIFPVIEFDFPCILQIPKRNHTFVDSVRSWLLCFFRKLSLLRTILDTSSIDSVSYGNFHTVPTFDWKVLFLLYLNLVSTEIFRHHKLTVILSLPHHKALVLNGAPPDSFSYDCFYDMPGTLFLFDNTASVNGENGLFLSAVFLFPSFLFSPNHKPSAAFSILHLIVNHKVIHVLTYT